MRSGETIQLSVRLQAVADLIPVCETLYDIGTDHAYLPIYCVQTRRCQKSVAIDRREGPLRRADANIRRFNLTDTITTALQDGMRDFVPGDKDAVSISGLGGVEIQRILQMSDQVTATFVLQPQKDLFCLRNWLAARGFSFEQEVLAIEKTHIYPVVKIRRDGQKRELSQLEAAIGPCLLKRRNHALNRYARQELQKLKKQVRSDLSLAPLIEAVSCLMEETSHE